MQVKNWDTGLCNILFLFPLIIICCFTWKMQYLLSLEFLTYYFLYNFGKGVWLRQSQLHEYVCIMKLKSELK